MIEKMKFISITGPKADIDRVVNTYLSKYEIHLENALSELTSVANLSPFLEVNPYRESLTAAKNFCSELEALPAVSPKEISIEEALSIVEEVQNEAKRYKEEKASLEAEHANMVESLKIIRHFKNIDFDISTILNFKFIHLRFGRIEKRYFQNFQNYIYENLDTLFFKCEEDEEYVYGVYFVPGREAQRIHAVYSSMHFERIFLPDCYTGTGKEAFQQLDSRHKEIHAALDANKAGWSKYLSDNNQRLVSAKAAIEKYSSNFDVRRLAACTPGESKVFFILCGWMSEKDALAFQNDIKDDTQIFCLMGNNGEEIAQQPPTKLKNPKLFKPFEMYVKMYGRPAYGEMDPTWFVAITYSFIFGAMFGDVGQGLLLFIGGFLLYHFKKIDLAGIISCAGFFSTIFGFLFGSIFGFEDVIPALWLRPMNAMMTVPFIGKLNTVFIVAIGFGMGIILLCMIFNIINAWRSKDMEKTWFDTNSVAGLVFYGSAVVSIGLILSGRSLPGTAVLCVMFLLPLLVIFFKEPLTNLAEKKAEVMPKQKGMFIVQGIFEMFEVLLSYFSNTLSFVRIGAFAVSHAAMMEVVLMLAGAESGSPNILVVVLGNLFVCGMEGLIVGIQVLRLEYYEIFSRFYKGTGRRFEPFRSK